MKNRTDEEESDIENDENENDPNFEVQEPGKKKGKINVKGKVSLTCDAMDLSVRKRIVVASSLANCFGIQINETNSIAWREGQEARLKKSS